MPWSAGGPSRIYYEEDGTGDSVLVVPGWGGSIQELMPLRSALASRYRVIAADLPGSGRSGPQPREYSRSYYHDDAEEFLAFLDEVAAAPAHIIGHSDGGEYALLMAQMRPSSVRSILTWGSAGRLAPPPGMLDTFRRVVEEPIPPLQQVSAHLKGTYGLDNARIMVRTQADALEAIVDAGGDLARALAGDIACPALLVTGEHDIFAPPPLVSEMVAEMGDARFLELKGAGHPVHLTHTEWLVSTVVDWLDAR
jgi:valacyclovir hydrolase